MNDYRSMKILTLAIGAAFLATGWTTAADPPQLSDGKSRASYGIGANLGTGLRRDSVEIDVDLLIRGLKEALAGKELPMTEPEIRDALQAYWQETRQRRGEANLVAGQAFLEANRTQPGVVTLPSGLQYKVLEEGEGVSPAATDIVTVHYRGTLIDGTEFDSSYSRNQPAEFAVNRVIPGWTEALQLMKPGAKWQVFIPSDLGYGANGSGRVIGPNATLLFDVELISFKAPEPPRAAPATPQPVTSDIIKVPSKEEMERGAKIEVIKKEDVERMIKEQQKEKE
jgi:FKBP-type peptidyl-prolyl cis-trans isomerase FklB